ncbi:MAG: ABC transporter ATP-binding protein [Dehalococcoidia bacterium]
MAVPDHIAVHALSKSFETNGHDLVALRGVELTVASGEFVSIIGPSGCGKTTLLKIIGGLLEPTAGKVTVRGVGPREAQRRKEIGFVFQDPSLLPWRTVISNVRLPLQVNRKGGNGAGPGAQALVEMVGLGQFADYYPHQLSAGMKQRVSLARALVFDPSLLLMDEPLGSLDEITRSAMRYELLRLWELTRKTVLMVTHSVAEAVVLSDRVAVMTGQPGRIDDIVTIDLPRPRGRGLERSEPFLDYTDRIQGLLARGGLVGTSIGPGNR